MAPRYPIALFLLLFLAIPAFPLIRTSTERELTARQVDVAAFDQTNAHIATDGSSFFTVWADFGGGVLGARLDSNGVVVDTTPLVIAADGTLPEIAWGVDRWLAVWQTENGVNARFIERDGTMREPFEITSSQLFNGVETHLAFNGSVFLVTWLDSINWRGRIIDLDGRLLAGVALPGIDRDTDLGVLAGTFYFAYAARNETNNAFLPKLTTIDASGAMSAPVQIGPENVLVEKFHIAARANDLLIAWSTSRGQGLNDVLVTVAGVGAVETIAVPFKWLENIVVDQIGYLLVYGDNNQKLARRAGLAAVALFDVEAPALTIMSDTVTNNTRTVSILRRFNAFDTMGGDLYLQNFGETAVRPLAAAPRHQERPDLAAAGDVKLAVWLEYDTAARTRVNVAMRLDSSGAPLGPPIAIGTTTNPYRPRVASNGTDWLVVWRTDLNVYARRVAHDGTLLDAAPLLLDGLRPQTDLDVVWDGTSYVVVWGGGVKLFISVLGAARIPASGNPSPAFIVESRPPVPNPVIAAGPNGALIVWNFSNQIHGALLSPSDVITPLTFSVPYGYVSSIAWNKDAFLVAMRGGTPFGAELSWMVVDAFGNVRSHTAIETKYANGTAHVSAFGDDFLLLWNDPEPHAAIIDRDGKVISGPVTIGEAVNSAVAEDGWVLTSHTIGLPSRLISRVFLQTIELVANARRRSVR
jgi:hypothetical protein